MSSFTVLTPRALALLALLAFLAGVALASVLIARAERGVADSPSVGVCQVTDPELVA